MSESLMIIARRALRVTPAALLCGLAACMTVVTMTADARADATGDYNVALQFYKDERWDLAARGFREFLTKYSTHEEAPSARLYLGQALVNQRKFDEARQVFRDYVAAYANRPEAAVARFRAAESSYFLQDYPAARRELGDYLSRHGEHELAHRAQQYLGQTLLKLNDARAAAAAFDVVVQKSQDSALVEESRYGLAQARERLGEREPATRLYRELAANAETAFAPDAQFRLGAIAFESQDYEDAAREFAAVATRFPGHRLASSAELNAGFAEYYRERFAEAVKHFERARTDDAHVANAGFWIGLAYKEAGDFAAACRELQAGYERDPQHELADKLLFHWADSELRREQYVKARELFLKVVQRWPDGERADDSLHLATEAALRSGDLEDAEKLNQQFEQKYAASGLRLLQQLAAGRIQLALADAALAVNPQSPAARQRLDRAAAEFSRIIAASDVPRTKSQARVQLARTYQRLGDPQRMVDSLDPLVEEIKAGQSEAEFVDALLLQAEGFTSLERHADAARAAELYLAQASGAANPAAALRMIVTARARLGERDAVKQALDRLSQVDQAGAMLPRAAYEAAEIAYGAKQWDWAAELFDRTVELGEDTGYRAAALSGLGYSRYEAGQHAAASETFARIVQEHSDDRRLASAAAHMQGLSLQMAGQSDAAAVAYLAGLKQFAQPEDAPPGDVDYEVGLNAYRCAKGAARLQREAGRIDDSDAAYAAAFRELKKQPPERQGELDKLINEWALLSYEAKRYERSDELFSLLIKERPDSDLADDARLTLGESHFFAERLAEARQAFEELQADPQADEFVRQRAASLLLDILAKAEDWPSLLKHAQAASQAFQEGAGRSYAQYRLGEAALQTGQLDLAEKVLAALWQQRAVPEVARAEWFPSVALLLAETHFQQKEYEQAESALTAFRRENPESPYLYQADEILGRCYKNRAMLPDARAAFTRVIESAAGRRTETAAKAQFNIAETFMIEKNYDAALAEYYKVYVNYRFPEWQAPALYQAGQCDEQQQRWAPAVKTYETLLREFPESEFVDEARERLTAVRPRAQATGSGSDQK